MFLNFCFNLRSFNVLSGGLYLIWCDTTIETTSVETLILVLVYVFFFKNFIADYCYCIEAISVGKGSLEKLKVGSKKNLSLGLSPVLYDIQ
jgi:hypothetical protein